MTQLHCEEAASKQNQSNRPTGTSSRVWENTPSAKQPSKMLAICDGSSYVSTLPGYGAQVFSETPGAMKVLLRCD